MVQSFNINVLSNKSLFAADSLLLFPHALPYGQSSLENYANGREEQFEAADTLATLVGQHGQFEEARNMLNRRTRNAVSPAWP